MVDLPKYVVSHDVTPSDPRTTAIHRNVIERLTAVKEAAVGHVLLLAGGGLAAELARAGILDQLFLLTGPIVLGRGRPLLDLDEPLPTRLLSAQALPPSCTILRYAVGLELPTSR
jgi:dihydrofolate reductase